jgi:hypothetical protein
MRWWRREEGTGHARPASITIRVASSWKVIKTVHLAADDKRHVLRPLIIISGNALLLQLTAMDLKLVQQGT